MLRRIHLNRACLPFLLFLFMLSPKSSYSQAQLNDFRSLTSGNWNISSTWEICTVAGNPGTWAPAVTIPSSANNVTIRATHTVTVPVTGPYVCRSLVVESTGKLYANQTTTNVYISIWGTSLICNGEIGNGATFDGISFNFEAASTSITGNGILTASRFRKNTNINITTNLTINTDVTLRWDQASNTQLFNATTAQSKFNVTINAGRTLNCTGSATNPGNVSIDGLDGLGSAAAAGTITVNGTLNVAGRIYLRTNNVTSATNDSCSWIINNGGLLKVGSIFVGASGTAGNFLRVFSGGKLEITGSPGIESSPAFTVTSILPTTGNTYFFYPGSFCEYSGTGDQFIPAIPTAPSSNYYGNLKLSGGGIKDLAQQSSALFLFKVYNNLEISNATGSPVFKSNNWQIDVGGNWINYNQSGFDEGTASTAKVNFWQSGVSTITCPGGEVFNFLRYQKTLSAQVQFINNVTVADKLEWAAAGAYNLNGNDLILKNSASAAISNSSTATRYIISERTDNASRVVWNIGTPSGDSTYIIPFGKSATGYVPFRFVVPAGVNADTIKVATYATPPTNLPWPTTPNVVTNLNGFFNPVPDNRDYTVDRFWQINNTALTSPTLDYTFTYLAAELPTIVSDATTIGAQSWNTSSSAWRLPVIGTGAAYTVNVTATNYFGPWTLVGYGSPAGAGLYLVATSITNATCPGINDGAINITASAGTAPYSFLWNDGVTTEDRNSISAGTYTVTATDALGTTASLQVIVTNQSSIPSGSGQIIGSSSICPGNTAKYYLSGITGATNYNWVISTPTPNATIVSGQGTDTIEVLFNTSFIGLQLCVTPSNNCGPASAVCKMIDNQGFAETVNVSIDAVSCFGGNDGSISITLSNETMAAKNPGLVISEIHPDPSGNDSPFEWVELVATDYINFNTTPYTIVFSNNGTATSKGWFQGGIPSPPPTNSTYAFAINSGTVSPGQIVYVGGSQMIPTGTKLRSINTATTSGDGGIGGAFLSSGVLGNGGGVADGVAVFKKSVSLIDSTTYPVDAVFFGTGIGVAAFSDTSAGFTLPTSDIYAGGHLRSNSFCAPEILGFYSITASGTFKSELGGFVSPRVFSTNSSTWSSATTGISVIGNGYSWSNGSIGNSITGLSAGTYTVSITTPDGCSIINSYTVTQPAVLSISNNIVNSSCPLATNGSITTTISGGVSPYTYQWSNGATTANINSLTAGVYTLTVTDANGCTKTQQATVLSGTNFPTVSLSNNSPICALGINGTINSTVSGGSTPYSYLWSNGATVTNINGLTSGIYTVTVTDLNGCSTITNSTLSELPPITISSFTPAATNAGFPVEIKGINFAQVSQVLFNNLISPSFQKFGDTLIIATVPNDSGSGTITLINTNGCTGSSSTSFTYLTDFSKLTLKVYLQGFYYGNGFMNLPLVNTGISGDGVSVDTIEVELRDPDNSNASVTRKKGVLKSNGLAEFELPGYCLGNDYWIVVRNRNHLETWSKLPVVFSLNTYYNFSNSLQFPVIVTSNVTMQSSTSVTAGGNVVSDGGTPVTSRGVCWSQNPNPTIALPTKQTVGSGLGTFSTTVSGLTAGTTYYLRAFATSAVGTSYGNTVTFNSQQFLLDIDGNIYDTVVIGTQTWMKQNLKVSKYRNGDPIPTNLNNIAWSNPSGAYSIYNNTVSNDSIYGKLYNWYTVADPRGLCPVGWHVPSDAEWNTLETALGVSAAELNIYGGRVSIENVGGKMKAVSTLWTATNTGATNSSGFTGLPGGYRDSDGTFNFIGNRGFWWSSTQSSTTIALDRSLYFLYANVNRNGNTMRSGFSVRCVRD